jgi:hypothetical protein
MQHDSESSTPLLSAPRWQQLPPPPPAPPHAIDYLPTTEEDSLVLFFQISNQDKIADLACLRTSINGRDEQRVSGWVVLNLRTPSRNRGARDPVFSFLTPQLPLSFLTTLVRSAHHTGLLPPRLPHTAPSPPVLTTARQPLSGYGGVLTAPPPTADPPVAHRPPLSPSMRNPPNRSEL